MTTLLYDGSFEGFLTAVFEVYGQCLADVRIRPAQSGATGLFGDSVSIAADEVKSARVWKGLKDKISAEAAKRLYFNHLSELEGKEDNMLQYIRYIFAADTDVSEDYSHAAVLRVAKVAKMVSREKHRMEAFVRFQLGPDGTFHAAIESDFNVLPLIVKHFESRYADQRWIIFDQRRNYGMYSRYGVVLNVVDRNTYCA
ncbi:MAG TPA: TIGR03915 family putative DNA repair protein, partial [Saprospiraceae bacterium]|nr:TIGR03915 family putative DNA repair protein [Saprospiraceae bacterium]HND89111.1 TIGR03915 family putative DNA repair protein [Saprospiraceae bacterium]